MKKITTNLLAILAVSMVAAPAMAQDEAEAKDSMVNVAFRKVAAQDIMGGVATVNYRELTEKNYNTYSLDNMQGYVSGYNGSGMWGLSDQLVLIDGVPRDANNVTPTEIESVTFLKGAQAVVLYGSKAAKGAILIQTKRGRVSDGLRVDVRANTGFNVAKAYPEYLGAVEYMNLYNEAARNDGKAAAFGLDLINKTASGLNPYRYPDVEFYSKDYIRNNYNRTDATLEIEGGNERAKFYANVSYYTQGDYLKFGEASNNRTDRFNVRGNVDMNLTNWLSAYVNANATFYNARTANGGSYWEAASTWRPNTLAPFIPLSYLDPNSSVANEKIGGATNFLNGMFLGGTLANQTNIFADYYFGGKNTWTSRQFQFDAGVNIDLNGVLKGLSFKTSVAIDYATSYSTAYNNKYMIFEPSWGEYNGQDVIYALTNHDTVDKHTGVQDMSGSANKQTIAFNAHFDYARSFGDHNVSAMLVANGYQQSTAGEYHKVSNANLGLTVDYNFARKYYATLSVATPWSAKLPEGKRAGFSPSVTLGWNMARENFMEGSVFNDLVLSASYSNLKTDLGIDDYYMYLAAIHGGGWWDWNGESGHAANQSKRGANNDLGYINRKEVSVNLRGSLLDRALTFDASFFRNVIGGQIIEANSQMPSYFFSYYPESSFRSYINFNDDTRTGFDLAVNYRKQLNADWSIAAGANVTYFTTKASKRDDVIYGNDTNRYRQGGAVDEIYGYKFLGFFKDQADIDASPKQSLGSEVKPGDMKYADINGDGIIDYKDETRLGHWGANTSLGVNVTLKFKNLTLFVLGTGSFGGNAIKNNSYWWVHGDGKYSAAVRDRVIVENGVATNAATALYPRLTTDSGANNFTTSDFWMYSTSQFNLAKVQLTYDFPKTMMGKIVKGLQVYVSGNSLLTVAKNREILEMNVGSAPQARFYNLGAKISF